MWTVLLLVICSCLPVPWNAEGCDENWFGEDCKLKCNCRDGCTSKGFCLSLSKCADNMFGSRCQYVKVQIEEGPSWLTDDDNSTCNPTKTRAVELKINSTLTWVRIILAQPGHSDVVLSFDENRQCRNMKIFAVDDYTVDAYCDNWEVVNTLILQGPGVEELCGLYISGGRNIALKQDAVMSTTHRNRSEFRASMAVDGRRNSNNSGYGFLCPHGAFEDPSPHLTLMLKGLYLVQGFSLYARGGGDEVIRRLLNFRLYFFAPNGTQIYAFNDNSTIPRLVYTYKTEVIAPVNRIVFKPREFESLTDQRPGIINFCEVEIFGELLCDGGTFGPACRVECDVRSEDDHQLKSGHCLGQCQAGEQYLGCFKECFKGFYGWNCSHRCSSDCLDQDCARYSGLCFACQDNKTGPYCNNRVCLKGHYGLNCSELCKSGCLDGDCNDTNGECISCKPHFTGPFCDKKGQINSDCGKIAHGPDCSFPCAATCKNQRCSQVDGACFACVPGFSGKMCDENQNSFGLSPVAVSFLILAIVVCAIALLSLYFKLPKNMLDPSEDESRKSEPLDTT